MHLEEHLVDDLDKAAEYLGRFGYILKVSPREWTIRFKKEPLMHKQVIPHGDDGGSDEKALYRQAQENMREAIKWASYHLSLRKEARQTGKTVAEVIKSKGFA